MAPVEITATSPHTATTRIQQVNAPANIILSCDALTTPTLISLNAGTATIHPNAYHTGRTIDLAELEAALADTTYADPF